MNVETIPITNTKHLQIVAVMFLDLKRLYALHTTLSICEGREFIARPARYKCPIGNIKLKLTTKSQINKCQPEPLMIVAHS
jgi:hypothetical protein